MAIIDLDTHVFDLAIRTSDKPVLIDFWAEWCAPCKMMLPILTEISDDYADILSVAKVNVDMEPDLAAGLSSIPTLRLYREGRVILEIVGAVPKRVLLTKLSEVLEGFDA